MTMALCFDCGHIKFGAICPCPRCGTSSTGDIQLDILFSDHHFSQHSLEQCGQLIKNLRKLADGETTFWTFMQYISTRHAELLSISLKEPMLSRANDLLKCVEIPKITLESRSFEPGAGTATTGG